jgi:hypothetical protein
MVPNGIPLAWSADAAVARLAMATGSSAIAELDGTTLLGERAMLGGFTIPARTSAGGGCRLFDAQDNAIALNLARSADRELLCALFETDALDISDDTDIARHIASRTAAWLVERGRVLGLAIAGEHEVAPSPLRPCVELVTSEPAARPGRPPRVLDLSALWAGPLAAHLLWLAGADVVKVESKRRPDAMREGDQAFYRLLNQGKASVALDLADPEDRQGLLQLIAASDIVIEAGRPRGLAQLGVDADAILRGTPGLVWISITGHGARGEPANWVGFGDDCGVAGGLSTALHAVSGKTGFVGDAIADPLTGLMAAHAAWQAWAAGRGVRLALAMSHVVASCLAEERNVRPEQCAQELRQWAASAGKPFPEVRRRRAGPVRPLGADTHSLLVHVA